MTFPETNTGYLCSSLDQSLELLLERWSLIKHRYRSLLKPFGKEVDALSTDRLLTYGPFSIVSGIPMDANLDDPDVVGEHHHNLQRELEQVGLAHIEVWGSYNGIVEPSFLVPHLLSWTPAVTEIEAAAVDLRREFMLVRSIAKYWRHQESVIHSLMDIHELHYLSGDHHDHVRIALGHRLFQDCESDFTLIPRAGGSSTRFTIDFQRGVLSPKESALDRKLSAYPNH